MNSKLQPVLLCVFPKASNINGTDAVPQRIDAAARLGGGPGNVRPDQPSFSWSATWENNRRFSKVIRGHLVK